MNERIRASPYYPVLVHPVFRRVLPGAAASAVGDGMSAVAIAWLALGLITTAVLARTRARAVRSSHAVSRS